MKFRFLTMVNSHNRFDFMPRFYDARKERLNLMLEKYKIIHSDAENEDDINRKIALRQAMTDSWGNRKNRVSQNKSANISVVIIVMAILFLGYYIFRKSAIQVHEQEIVVHQMD